MCVYMYVCMNKKNKTQTRNKARRAKERKEKERNFSVQVNKKQIINKQIMYQTLCWVGAGGGERRVTMLTILVPEAIYLFSRVPLSNREVGSYMRLFNLKAIETK